MLLKLDFGWQLSTTLHYPRTRKGAGAMSLAAAVRQFRSDPRRSGLAADMVETTKVTLCMVRPCVARDFRRSVGFGSRINVSGLSLERVLRAIMDLSARAFSLAVRPQVGHLGHQGSHAPGRPSSISSQSLADLGGETGCDVMSSLAPYRCSSFVRGMRPFLRPGVRLKSGSARRGRQGWPSRFARLGRWRFQATP